MKNFDRTDPEYLQLANGVVQASKDGDETAFSEAMAKFAQGIEQRVMAEAEQVGDTRDVSILAARGIRQLTSAEHTYYQKVIDAIRSNNPQQSLNNLDVVMPETIIDDVFEDLEQDHPLLSVVDFQYGRGITTWLMNTNEEQLATWSELCADIVKELTSGFKSLTVSQNKLSAFMPVCKAMLDLGPLWLDRYIRAVLREALAIGLEDGIINGRGQAGNIHEPIGMRKDLTKPIDQTTGYEDKDKVTVTSLDPVAYGALLASMAKTEKGNPRRVQNLIMIVNPTDYLTKVMPATTVMSPMGTYVNNVLPVPTRIIESIALAEGEAIIGMADRYFFVSGSGKDGIVAYSDEYRFLEDERVYLTKLYGHGQAKDNNAFQLLDISNLAPTFFRVQNMGEADGGTIGG